MADSKPKPYPGGALCGNTAAGAILWNDQGWPVLRVDLVSAASLAEVREYQALLDGLLKRREGFIRLVVVEVTWQARERAAMAEWIEARRAQLARYSPEVVYVASTGRARAAVTAVTRLSVDHHVFDQVEPALAYSQELARKLRRGF